MRVIVFELMVTLSKDKLLTLRRICNYVVCRVMSYPKVELRLTLDITIVSGRMNNTMITTVN